MLKICTDIQAKYGASGVAITHRLGEVGVGEESILVAIGTKHRGEAWRGGEEALERCKKEVEVWKMERFEDGGVWRANRDGVLGEKVEEGELVKEAGKGEGGKVVEPVVIRSDPLPSEEETKRPGPPLEKGHGPVVHQK
jgi:molybdopterin synthase catalytic subunit